MDTAEETKRIDPMKCVICQESVGRHPMKVKIDRKVRRICNRVDEEHADWLLDNRMDVNYLRITNKRRGGILGIIVLMLAFVALIWAFIYTTNFKPVFVVVAGALSAAIVLFVVSEFRTITVSDRMRSMLHQVEVDRPIIPPEPHPSLGRLDEIAALAGEAEPEMGRVSIHSVEPAPTQASALPTLAPEDGVPGFPQPVVTPKEWEIMDVEDQGPGAPQPAPGTPTPPVPAPPTIEDLPEETAPAPAPGTRPPVPPGWPPAQTAPPVAPPPPPPAAVQQPPPPPPVAAPPAPIGELPSEAARPSPPSQTLASQAPQAPPSPPPRPYQPPAPPPVQQYPAQVPPPAQQYPAQVPPPEQQYPAQAPPPVQQYPAQVLPPVHQPPAQVPLPIPQAPPQVPPPTPLPPAQPQPVQQVQQRKPKAPDEDVEEAEWVDWE